MPNYYPQTDLSQQNQSWMIAKIKELEAMITGGGLKVVTLAAEMIDHSIIYIYEGSESGMNPHHWYYWDTLSSAWTDGGYWGGTEVTFPIAVNKGGTGATAASGARTNLGLGTIAVENSPLPVNKGGTGQTTVAAARNAFGLGNTTGALPIANGGTGQTTAAAARNALGLGNTTGALPVANGGTGSTTATAALSALGAEPAITTLPINKGGTGATSASAALSALGGEPAFTTLGLDRGGTGVTTLQALKDLVGEDTVKFSHTAVANGGTATFTLNNADQGLLICNCNPASGKQVILYHTTGSGIVSYKELITGASSVTVTTGTNQLMVTNSSGVSMSFLRLNFTV